MSSQLGHHLKLSIFGESRGPAIGVVLDGLPPGEAVDLDTLQAFLNRRAPGSSALVTKRKESDAPEILSGMWQGKTSGSPLAASIRNNDTRSHDYNAFADTPRPSHADYTAAIRYRGAADMRGSGHFSGRLTAPLCVAGGIALQLLARKGIQIGAHLVQLGTLKLRAFDPCHISETDLQAARNHPLNIIEPTEAETATELLKTIASEGDSIGGLVEGAVLGLPPGLGSPMFDGLENRIAQALFGIPGVRGLEFGTGFAAAAMRGSTHNDPFAYSDDRVVTESNHAGGVIGGISTGMPLLCTMAMKPTASIAKKQQTVSLNDHHKTELTIHGRHDPCIAIRAVPVMEATLAFVILDMLLEEGMWYELN